MTLLDQRVYGLKKVQESCSGDSSSSRFNNPSTRTILALNGPPGVGKSVIASIIAEAIGRKYAKECIGSFE